MRPIFATLVLVLAFCAPALAQSDAETDERFDTIFGEHEPYGELFEHIKASIAQNDAEWFSQLVEYPLTVNGVYGQVANGDEMIDRFDEIITDRVRAAVAAQDYATLFVNAEGAMFGNGELWFSGICDDSACGSSHAAVIAINND